MHIERSGLCFHVFLKFNKNKIYIYYVIQNTKVTRYFCFFLKFKFSVEIIIFFNFIKSNHLNTKSFMKKIRNKTRRTRKLCKQKYPNTQNVPSP